MKNFRTRHDNHIEVAAPTCPQAGEDGHKTKTAHKAECDIKTIMAKYAKTGQLPELIKKEPQYGDFSNPLDYQDSMNLVIKAKEQFEALPAKARERFMNDPARFLAAVSDPEQAQTFVDLGLATLRKTASDDAPAAQPMGKGRPSPSKRGSSKPDAKNDTSDEGDE